jgi:hypothetical protein
VPTPQTCRDAVTYSIFHNTYAFSDSYDLVAGDVFQALNEAAWPANLDAIGLGGFAQPEMQAEVALGNVSAAAADLLRLLVIANADGDSGADSVAVRLRAFQFQ